MQRRTSGNGSRFSMIDELALTTFDRSYDAPLRCSTRALPHMQELVLGKNKMLRSWGCSNGSPLLLETPTTGFILFLNSRRNDLVQNFYLEVSAISGHMWSNVALTRQLAVCGDVEKSFTSPIACQRRDDYTKFVLGEEEAPGPRTMSL